MKSYEQIWFIEPLAKGRPRFTRYGHSFTDKKTREYEATLRELYKGGKMEGAVAMWIEFGMPVPKSASKKNKSKMLADTIHHTKKPDTDNMVKAVTDALNGVAYDDDSQIICISARKRYAAEPHVLVKIYEVE